MYHKLGALQDRDLLLTNLELKVQNQGVSRVTVFPEAPLEEGFRIFQLLVAASAPGLVGSRANLCP